MRFTIFSDHRLLEKLETRPYMEVTDTRMQRTTELLNIYNFEVRYIPRKQNMIADCLSRKPMWARDETVGDLPADLSEEHIRRVVEVEDACV